MSLPRSIIDVYEIAIQDQKIYEGSVKLCMKPAAQKQRKANLETSVQHLRKLLEAESLIHTTLSDILSKKDSEFLQEVSKLIVQNKSKLKNQSLFWKRAASSPMMQDSKKTAQPLIRSKSTTLTLSHHSHPYLKPLNVSRGRRSIFGVNDLTKYRASWIKIVHSSSHTLLSSTPKSSPSTASPIEEQKPAKVTPRK